MQRHLVECGDCAALDSKVRRSLMVFRNLPAIEVSADFGRRLEQRLRECDAETEAACTNFRAIAAVGAVASLFMLGFVAASFRHTGAVPTDIALPPVVAVAARPVLLAEPNSFPEALSKASAKAKASASREKSLQPTIVGARMPAIAASVSAGMPLLPVTMFVEQGPLHFVTYREAH